MCLVRVGVGRLGRAWLRAFSPGVDSGVLRFSLEVMGSESGNLIQRQQSRREDRLRVGVRNRRPEPS